MRPPSEQARAGSALSADAAPAGPPGYRPGTVPDGGAGLCAGHPLHPPGADGRLGSSQAVSGHAPPHADFCRPDGGALHGAGLRPQGSQLPGGAGPARRWECRGLRRGRGHPPGRCPDGGLRRRPGPPAGKIRPVERDRQGK